MTPKGLVRKGIARKPFKRKSGRIKVGVTKRPKTRLRANLSPTEAKIWGLKRADNEFRLLMLKTVPVQCVFPNCFITDPSKLTVSHYHGRAKKGTRFDIENCVFLCRNHHYWDKRVGWEFQKQRREDARAPWDGRYTTYMKETLGEERFIALEERSNIKIGPRAAIRAFQESLRSQENLIKELST